MSVCFSLNGCLQRKGIHTMDKIFKRLSNLISVKSVVTLVLTAIFAIMALRGDITGKDFLTIFLMVISFYFGTQSQKAQDAIDNKSGADNAES